MVSYKQQTVALDEDETLESVMGKIRDLKGQVVVNIVTDPRTAPVFFSTENIDAARSFKKKALIFETLPEKQYRQLMMKEMQLISESSEKLRVLLRDHFLDDIKEIAQRYLDQIQNVALLLSCYALQKPESGVAGNMDSLKTLFKQLNAACIKSRDNVRFMDDLQYGVIPILQVITKEMLDQ